MTSTIPTVKDVQIQLDKSMYFCLDVNKEIINTVSVGTVHKQDVFASIYLSSLQTSREQCSLYEVCSEDVR